MTTGRLLVAGLAVVSTLMAADASAQDCPEWFKWLCPDASSNPATKEAAQPGQGKELARTKANSNSASGNKARTTSRSAADIATNPKSQQSVQEASRQAKAGRTAGGGEQRLAREGEQRAGRLGATTNDQEKELFDEFLVWFNEHGGNSRSLPAVAHRKIMMPLITAKGSQVATLSGLNVDMLGYFVVQPDIPGAQFCTGPKMTRIWTE